MATTQQQPKPDAQDEEGEEQQHSGTEQKPNVAPLRFIEQLVDSSPRSDSVSNMGRSSVRVGKNSFELLCMAPLSEAERREVWEIC